VSRTHAGGARPRILEEGSSLGDEAGRKGVDRASSIPPEAIQALKSMQEELHRRWLDEAIPALGGLTPREAAKRKGEPRKELELLLAEIEHAEARRPPDQRFDVSVLRHELGLSR